MKNSNTNNGWGVMGGGKEAPNRQLDGDVGCLFWFHTAIKSTEGRLTLNNIWSK